MDAPLRLLFLQRQSWKTVIVLAKVSAPHQWSSGHLRCSRGHHRFVSKDHSALNHWHDSIDFIRSIKSTKGDAWPLNQSSAGRLNRSISIDISVITLGIDIGIGNIKCPLNSAIVEVNRRGGITSIISS